MRVHLSQPSLSVAIKNLEDLYQVKLFERNSRHVELTDAGRRFVPVARRILEELDRAGDFLRGVAGGEPEVFRIGYSPFLDLELVSAIRLEFAQVNIDLPTAFIGCPTAAQIRALQKGDLHVGLLVGQIAPLLAVERLGREPLRVAFQEGHRLEKLSCVSISDIVQEPVVWFKRD